ncbi:MAG TPA: class I SAM-dependent methyltransferase [Luteitalea sp.]|nr:class I SAM-dependent methyltransferase [Luteitalea sp.]
MTSPYDDLPYRSSPIPWTSPDRLAVASLLHGGPRLRSDAPYRVLEIGCGDGSNLVALALHWPHATFVGLDNAAVPLATARERAETSGASNTTFIFSDIQSADAVVEGRFDIILAHGVFSWVPPTTRDALLTLCASRLGPGGLVYLNYNARPGWSVRGLVRDYLLNATEGIADLHARTSSARELASVLADRFAGSEHPYSQLMANEFRFVVSTDPSHTAHEYLAPDNHAYSREQFLQLAERHSLVYIADADFNYPSGRLPEQLSSVLDSVPVDARLHAATADLLCYRQLHSPILTHDGWQTTLPTLSELEGLFMASGLVLQETDEAAGAWCFAHPSGAEVRVTSPEIAAALLALVRAPGIARRLRDLFVDVAAVVDDVRLLHRNGMIELAMSRLDN